MDFEWPQIDDYLGLEEPTIQSIEFKSDRIHQLISVKCILKNLIESPEFSAPGLESENYGTIDFTSRKQPITQVQSNSSVEGRIYSIWLNDGDGNEVLSYNTTNSGQNGLTFSLTPTEEIIGVYGARAGKTRIISFGFIAIDKGQQNQ